MGDVEQYTIPSGSDAARRMETTTGSDIIAAVMETAALLEEVEGKGEFKKAEAWHKEYMLHIAEDFASQPTIVHQALQWAFMAVTAINTFFAVVDYANFQAEVLEAEDGTATA